MSIIGRVIKFKDRQQLESTGVVIDKVINGFNQQSPSTMYLVENKYGEVCTVLPNMINKIMPVQLGQDQKTLDEILNIGQQPLDGVGLVHPTTTKLLDDDDLPF